ncbi:hypothetical protein PMAYCL1PPCAC_01933, partial [Pristionchus mayeri]
FACLCSDEFVDCHSVVVVDCVPEGRRLSHVLSVFVRIPRQQEADHFLVVLIHSRYVMQSRLAFVVVHLVLISGEVHIGARVQ